MALYYNSGLVPPRPCIFAKSCFVWLACDFKTAGRKWWSTQFFSRPCAIYKAQGPT